MDNPLVENSKSINTDGGTFLRSRRQTGPLIVLVGGEYEEENTSSIQDLEKNSGSLQIDDGSNQNEHNSERTILAIRLKQILIALQWVTLLLALLDNSSFSYMMLLVILFLGMLFWIATTDKVINISFPILVLLDSDREAVALVIIYLGLLVVSVYPSQIKKGLRQAGAVMTHILQALWVHCVGSLFGCMDKYMAIISRLCNVNFKKMQQKHEEELRDSEEELMQKLEVQKEKLAYLESTHISRPPMLPLLAIGAACLWSLTSIFYFSCWMASIQMDTVVLKTASFNPSSSG